MTSIGDHPADGLSETAGKLLAAAEELVVQQGITGLSVRKVGDRAGANPALVTYHFGGIGALLETLCAFNLDPMLLAWEGLEGAAAESIDSLLRCWLVPLLQPAAFTPGGRALIVLDEIASHGHGDARQRVMDEMLRCSQRVQALLAPHCPHLEQGELRARVRFVSASVLGPPPRIHGAPATSEGIQLDSPDFLLRFARTAFAN